MLIDVRRRTPLGVDEGLAAVAVPTPEPRPGTAFPPRRLTLRGQDIFDLNLWCGTCPALFQRLAEPLAPDLAVASDQLARGVDAVDDEVLELYGSVLPRSVYTTLLLELWPRLVAPGDPDDYYVREQVATWGIDPVVGAPENPGTPYYRTFETTIDAGGHLFELVVPMVPSTWSDAEQVKEYVDGGQATATAVAYSLLDVLEPLSREGVDHYQHWVLTHFLLDGHHKLEAAARAGRPLRLLSVLDERKSISTSEDVDVMIEALNRRPSERPSVSEPREAGHD